MMIKTIVRPIGAQIERLKANANTDHYTINARLEKRKYNDLLVWIFNWEDVEEDSVREAMAWNFAIAHNITYSKACKQLALIVSAIPVNECVIEEIED